MNDDYIEWFVCNACGVPYPSNEIHACTEGADFEKKFKKAREVLKRLANHNHDLFEENKMLKKKIEEMKRDG